MASTGSNLSEYIDYGSQHRSLSCASQTTLLRKVCPSNGLDEFRGIAEEAQKARLNSGTSSPSYARSKSFFRTSRRRIPDPVVTAPKRRGATTKIGALGPGRIFWAVDPGTRGDGKKHS